MRYIGFDLGDGESAVASYEHGSGIEPMILSLAGVKSLISAVGLVNGNIVIGENAYTNALADFLSVRFKSRFTSDPKSYEDIVRFAKGVLLELFEHQRLSRQDRLVVGCPAGWNAATRTRYRELLMQAGFQNPHVISESRAAFLYAKYAKTVALDIDVLNDSALVADIGSSTLDFAYIVDGRETGIGTFGETMLGGGILDAALLRRAVSRNRHAKEIEQTFRECRSWYSYCEIETRRLKEEYFNRLAEEEHPIVKKQLGIYYDVPVKLNLEINEKEMEEVVTQPLPELDGRSFAASVREAVDYACKMTKDRPPRLLLLTGGASRMKFFREICREVFPEVLLICCPEPEFSIAKGLAYAGWVDENLEAFRNAIRAEITAEKVSAIAQRELAEKIPELVQALCELLIEQAALPVIRLWKQGEIDTLEHLNERLNERVRSVLSSPMAENAIAPVIEAWVQGLSDDLQAMVNPICDRYEVPRKQMQLNFTSSGENAADLDAGQWVGLPVVGGVMGLSLSAVVAFICGGSGIALIAAGPLGFVAGACIGGLVSLLGWGIVSKEIMRARLPKLFRQINIEKALHSDKVRRQISDALMNELAPEKSAFQVQTVEGFTKAFQGYLYTIAQAAEIPIS